VKVRDVIGALERDGWRLDGQVGCRRRFRHPDRPRTVTAAGEPSEGDDLLEPSHPLRDRRSRIARRGRESPATSLV